MNQGESEDEEPEGGDITPSKGEVYGYKPPKSKKTIDCEVTQVLKQSKLCTLKSLDDDTVYNKVKWSELSEAE